MATTELKATADGHLYPHLHDLKLDFSKTKLKHQDPWKQFWLRQCFDLAKYILQSAYDLFGVSIINRTLYERSTILLNDQLYNFQYALPQIDKKGDFNLNWRLTADPLIHHNELDLSFFFDIGPETHHCMVEADTHDYYF